MGTKYKELRYTIERRKCGMSKSERGREVDKKKTKNKEPWRGIDKGSNQTEREVYR